MCGRVVQTTPPSLLAKRFGTANPLPNARERFNLCPTEAITVVRFNPKTRERSLDQVTWGLIPIWAKDRKIAGQCFNARAESVATKPAFRDAYASRRCLVPVDAFYEWKKLDAKTKQPYAIRALAEGDLLVFAGVWERWKNPETGEIERSASILTTTANEQMAELHDRMPVILWAHNVPLWLGEEAGNPEAVASLLAPWPDPLTIYPVGREVGSNRVDHAGLIEPLAA